MKRSFLLSALAIPALLAQAPTQPSLGQRLFTESPAIEKLLADLQPREAYSRSQAFLPTELPPYDKTNLQTTRKSFMFRRDIARAYHLVGRTAYAAGYWEKAFEYFTKAKEVARQNQEESKPIFTQAKEGFGRVALETKAKLEGNAEYINAQRAKAQLDENEKKEMETVKTWEKELADNDSFSKLFLKDIDTAQQDVTFYDSLPGAIEEAIKGEADQLAAYKFKNDKDKWVEGIMAYPNYLDAYKEKRDKVQFLYRLTILSPGNKKVIKAIDVLQGNSAPEPKGKPAPKKKA